MSILHIEPNPSEAVSALEQGKILLFPELDFKLRAHEIKFLSPSIACPQSKNVSFNCHTGLVNGLRLAEDKDQLKAMMQRFQQKAQQLVETVLSPYTSAIQIGRTSFRPVEISGRMSSYRKDDTRLHVDAFPSSPNQGKRILRVFTNINPHGQDRIWRVGEPFVQVAQQFLPTVRKSWPGRSTLYKLLKITKSYCTEYDYTMLQIHNNMKANGQYQKNAQQQEVRFPPGCTWIVQTDHVSHAATQGQYVLEQTFYLPINAMQNPALSPLRTLEKLAGRALI